MQARNTASLMTEEQAVREYKLNSEIYKNAQKAAIQLNGEKHLTLKERMKNLGNAQSFSEMIKLVDGLPAAENFAVEKIFKAVCYVGSFFSTEASFGHYQMQLKSDIISYAVDKGFHQIETNTTTLKQ